MTYTNQQVYDALTDCIEKRWVKIVKGGGIREVDIPTCHLCELFYYKTDDCSPCPLKIYEGTEQPTPFAAACTHDKAAHWKWANAGNNSESAAKEVLRVLRATKKHFFGDWK